MRRLAFLFALLPLVGCGLAESERDERNKYVYLTFADPAFERYCLDHFDTSRDGRLSRYEAERVRRMDCAGLGIREMFEIRFFTRLERLDCSRNELAQLVLTDCRLLAWLACGDNRLTLLDVNGLRGLTTLSCSGNRLERLNLGSNSSLSQFEARENPFRVLDVSLCSLAMQLVDVRDCRALGMLYIGSWQRIYTLLVNGPTEVAER